MEGLYKKVIKGVYPKIPQHYSQDLNNVVRSLLQVSPHLRPDCGFHYTIADKISALPAVARRVDGKFSIEVDEGELCLLNTIKFPQSLHYLTEQLPKPNYCPLKIKPNQKPELQKTQSELAKEKPTHPEKSQEDFKLEAKNNTNDSNKAENSLSNTER